MNTYETERGIGREIELLGIKSSYIIVLAAGLAAGLLLCFILYISGTGLPVAAAAGGLWCASFAAAVIWANRNLGEKGLVKRLAGMGIPRGVRIGIRIRHLFKGFIGNGTGRN